jgi:hypothetical protein
VKAQADKKEIDSKQYRCSPSGGGSSGESCEGGRNGDGRVEEKSSLAGVWLQRTLRAGPVKALGFGSGLAFVLWPVCLCVSLRVGGRGGVCMRVRVIVEVVASSRREGDQREKKGKVVGVEVSIQGPRPKTEAHSV